MVAHAIQSLHPPCDFVPPGFNISRADLVHRAGKHHSKLVVGELKNIRQPLLDRQLPGAKDFFTVNIRLQRFQRPRSVVQIGHDMQGSDGSDFRQVDAGRSVIYLIPRSGIIKNSGKGIDWLSGLVNFLGSTALSL